MSAAFRAWQAGFVRRWHTNFDLCDTSDCDAGHQGRVAVLVLSLFPAASRELLIHAVTHDQGEVAPGDVSYDAKRANPALAAMAGEMEAAEIARQGLPQPALSPADRQALKLCDWLDAWLWMIRHRHCLAMRADWAAQFSATLEMAEALGVKDRVLAMAKAAMETRP